MDNLASSIGIPEKQPTFRESVSWIEGIPLPSFRLKFYKLKALNTDLAAYFNKLTKPPLDTALLVSFYLLVSFVPSLLFSILSSLLLPKKTQ